ncbi:MAG: hypothetical protein EOO92_08770, partial [Pedobacter sp.]
MQNYKNHIRFYVPHHFIYYPIVGFLFGFTVWQAAKSDEQQVLWVFLTVLVFMVGWASFMMRQHYALTIQNRLVLLEVRFRYYTLTQQRFEVFEHQLTFSQIAALRFASDAEFTILVEKTLKEN